MHIAFKEEKHVRALSERDDLFARRRPFFKKTDLLGKFHKQFHHKTTATAIKGFLK